jgi:hypothetical protein
MPKEDLILPLTCKISLKLKTLNIPNDNCSKPNDYTNKTTNGIQKNL